MKKEAQQLTIAQYSAIHFLAVPSILNLKMQARTISSLSLRIAPSIRVHAYKMVAYIPTKKIQIAI